MLVHFENLWTANLSKGQCICWNMYPSILWIGLIVYSCGSRQFWGLEFLTLVRSVHLVDLCMFFNPNWIRPFFWTYVGCLTLVGSVHFVDANLDSFRGPFTLWTYVKFFTLVGSVHCVDMNFDPSWGPSTFWTYVSFWPLLGPFTLWIRILIPRGVRPPCGLM